MDDSKCQWEQLQLACAERRYGTDGPGMEQFRKVNSSLARLHLCGKATHKAMSYGKLYMLCDYHLACWIH